MIDASKYRISVQRRETEDGLLFEGTVFELSDVLTLGDSYIEAYELAIDAIESLADLTAEMGHSFPQPSVRETEYSGKFVIRMRTYLHRRLATEAADQGVSLNAYAVSILSGRNAGSVETIQYVSHPETKLSPDLFMVSSGTAVRMSGLGGYIPIIMESGGESLVHPFEKEASAPDWLLSSQSKEVSNAA